MGLEENRQTKTLFGVIKLQLTLHFSSMTLQINTKVLYQA